VFKKAGRHGKIDGYFGAQCFLCLAWLSRSFSADSVIERRDMFNINLKSLKGGADIGLLTDRE